VTGKKRPRPSREAAPTSPIVGRSASTEGKDAGRQVAGEPQPTELLLKTADTLSRWTGIDAALEQLAAILLRTTSPTRVTINLWNEQRQELRTVASNGRCADGA